jgi:hypothetical protein
MRDAYSKTTVLMEPEPKRTAIGNNPYMYPTRYTDAAGLLGTLQRCIGWLCQKIKQVTGRKEKGSQGEPQTIKVEPQRGLQGKSDLFMIKYGVSRLTVFRHVLWCAPLRALVRATACIGARGSATVVLAAAAACLGPHGSTCLAVGNTARRHGWRCSHLG